METYTVKVNNNGDKLWYQDGKRHRTDGPAIEYAHGTKEWFLNGQRHRVDGPAIEYPNGTKEYWINGRHYSENEFNTRTNSKELSVAEIEKLLGYKIKIVDK